MYFIKFNHETFSKAIKNHEKSYETVSEISEDLKETGLDTDDHVTIYKAKNEKVSGTLNPENYDCIAIVPAKSLCSDKILG